MLICKIRFTSYRYSHLLSHFYSHFDLDYLKYFDLHAMFSFFHLTLYFRLSVLLFVFDARAYPADFFPQINTILYCDVSTCEYLFCTYRTSILKYFCFVFYFIIIPTPNLFMGDLPCTFIVTCFFAPWSNDGQVFYVRAISFIDETSREEHKFKTNR